MNTLRPGNGKPPKLAMPKIPLKDIPLHKCVRCSHTGFIGAVELRPVSKLLSASGQDEILQTKILVCSMCGAKVLQADLSGKV